MDPARDRWDDLSVSLSHRAPLFTWGGIAGTGSIEVRDYGRKRGLVVGFNALCLGYGARCCGGIPIKFPLLGICNVGGSAHTSIPTFTSIKRPATMAGMKPWTRQQVNATGQGWAKGARWPFCFVEGRDAEVAQSWANSWHKLCGDWLAVPRRHSVSVARPVSGGERSDCMPPQQGTEIQNKEQQLVEWKQVWRQIKLSQHLNWPCPMSHLTLWIQIWGNLVRIWPKTASVHFSSSEG